jgi:hypothetical protein
MEKQEQKFKVLMVLVVLALGLGGTGLAVGLMGGGSDVEARVRERISIDAREDAFLYNAADLYVYSDNHTTQKFHVDGATGNTTIAGTLATTGNIDFTGTLQYGADDLYPVGYASSGQQLVYGTASITGTAAVATGLSTVTFALCTLAEDPTAGAGDAAYCTVTVAANVVTVKAWQDDFVTAATETEVDVNWIVVGAP